MMIDGAMKVGQVAAEHPLATRVFARHDIDFCCGGGRELSAVCEDRGLDVDALVAEIRQELERTDDTEASWNDAPLDRLIDHIESTYHASLREELPRLTEMSARVLRVHGDKDPRLETITHVITDLRAELESHMVKEERVLFPMIKAGRGSEAAMPVAVMEHEHETAAGALQQLRELTDDFEVPAAACNTWRALWHGLADLERAMHQHIHLENNILFPRALSTPSAI